MTNNEYQDLIAFLGRKFEEIDRRFDAVDSRFEGMDRRFDRVEAKLAEHDARFEAIEERFDSVEAKLAEHDKRFSEILGHFDHLYKWLERLEQEYHALVEGLRRVETLLTDEKGKRELLERALEELKRHVAALQLRIEAVEQRLHA